MNADSTGKARAGMVICVPTLVEPRTTPPLSKGPSNRHKLDRCLLAPWGGGYGDAELFDRGASKPADRREIAFSVQLSVSCPETEIRA